MGGERYVWKKKKLNKKKNKNKKELQEEESHLSFAEAGAERSKDDLWSTWCAHLCLP